MNRSLLCTLATALVCAPRVGAAQSPLPLRQPVSGTVTGKDTIRYQLRADSAWVIRLEADQRAGNVALRLLGPRKSVVRAANATRTGREALQVVTTEGGDYQLQVVAGDSVGGAFSVTLLVSEKLSSDPRRLVDQLLAPWDRRDGPGAAVAVWRGGKTMFAKAYGMANLAYDIPFTVSTPTNIGSTSKQFTAFAVVLLVEEGKLSLDDDVRKHFPELKDFGHTVTVRHLLTHTSGYREIYNSLSLTGRRIDEGDHISRDEFIPLVNHQPSLQAAPGTEFNYNNTGYGMLAMLVARVSKQPFEQFMAERVFGPVGMTSTRVRADHRAPVRGSSTGYSRGPDGTWRELGDLGGAMGAGAIYTTVGDLQRWAEHVVKPRVGTAAMITQMSTPFTLANGKSTGYGFGLLITEQSGLTRLTHSGGDIAHRSELVVYPSIDAGVTVQSNDASFNSSIALRIAEAFFPELAKKPAVAAAAPVATTAPAPVPVPTGKQLAQLAGRYYSDELESFWELAVTDGQLTVAHRRLQPVRLVPKAADAFTGNSGFGNFTLVFERDRSGQVIGFYADNARSRDIRFERVR